LKLKLRVIILVFALAFLSFAKAQDNASTIEQQIATIVENFVAENEDESIDFESLYDELIQMAQHPVNLNIATQENLEAIPFLTNVQVENILYYRYRFGTFNTIYELQLVDGLDMTDIRNVLPFIFVGKADEKPEKLYFSDVVKYGKNTLLLRLDRTIEQKAGYIADADGEKAYLGDQFYNYLKYRFKYRNRISAGFTAEKDAGETFVRKGHIGYDFYSFHILANNIGKFKTIALGDYRVSFGQGLVLSSGFGAMKSSMATNVVAHSAGIKAFTSTDENNFFRGAAATAGFGKFEVSAFYSNKNIDAAKEEDSFATFYKTGLHRNESELLKKHTINQQIAGFHTVFNSLYFRVGITSVYTAFNADYLPETSGYKFNYFSGRSQWNTGVYYRTRFEKINIFGETAALSFRHLATINGISVSPVSQISLVALMRYYSEKYDVFYATAFSENTRPNNESGIYLGAEIHPFRRWKISAFADSYRFPWMKYQTDAPSFGNDYLLQIDYVPSRYVSMYIRMRAKDRMQNSSSARQATPIVEFQNKKSLRYELKYASGNFSFKNTIEANAVGKFGEKWTYGFTALQDMSYKPVSLPLTINLRYHFFEAENYDNRFSLYENDVLYAFSIPMFYGRGSRYYINLKYEIGRKLALWLKLSQTVYADNREEISSGHEKIIGNRKTDLRFMLQYEF
jgi:DNA uptake protein ComE-like DNA-binding protein